MRIIAAPRQEFKGLFISSEWADFKEGKIRLRNVK